MSQLSSTESPEKKPSILLLLKTPPPYGGGEIRGASLRDYVIDKPDFFVMELSSAQRDKSSQLKFEFWKIGEFLSRCYRFVQILRHVRPTLAFISLPKTFVAFFRDSLFILIGTLFGVRFAVELAGQMFYFLEGNLKKMLKKKLKDFLKA